MRMVSVVMIGFILKVYVADDKVLKFYEEIVMFIGLMDFDIYEQLCEKMLKN